MESDFADDFPKYVITPLGLRRLALEVREDAGIITKREGRELREIRAGVKKGVLNPKAGLGK